VLTTAYTIIPKHTWPHHVIRVLRPLVSTSRCLAAIPISHN